MGVGALVAGAGNLRGNVDVTMSVAIVLGGGDPQDAALELIRNDSGVSEDGCKVQIQQLGRHDLLEDLQGALGAQGQKIPACDQGILVTLTELPIHPLEHADVLLLGAGVHPGRRRGEVL